MIRRLIVTLVALLTSAALASGCATFTKNQNAATVNDHELSVSDFETALKDVRTLQAANIQAMFTDVSMNGDSARGFLGNWIIGNAVLDSLKGTDKEPTADFLKQTEATVAQQIPGWDNFSQSTKDFLLPSFIVQAAGTGRPLDQQPGSCCEIHHGRQPLRRVGPGHQQPGAQPLMGLPRVIVVGLGPGDPALVTPQTRAAILRSRRRFLRTAVHPSAWLVPDAVSFDHLYEAADTFGSVYDEITEALVSAASESGEVLYAVPGSPLVLERVVQQLRKDARVDCVVLPAVSFLDAVYSALDLDPVETALTLVDGHEFATAAAGRHGPLLIAHCHANWVLSNIKLATDDAGAGNDDVPVVVLHALGTPHEQIVHSTWAEMDQVVEANHLTSVYVPALKVAVAEHYSRFHALARTLREQCPWDIEQTHSSLIPYLIEETYEVVDALQLLDADDPSTDELLIEELGDLLYQVEFHATIAEQQGRFTIADVTQGIHDKLVRRHPHVFGDVLAGTTDEVLTNWDAIKMAEKGRTSHLRRHSQCASVAIAGLQSRQKGGEDRLRLALDRGSRTQDCRGDGRSARSPLQRGCGACRRGARRFAVCRGECRPPSPARPRAGPAQRRDEVSRAGESLDRSRRRAQHHGQQRRPGHARCAVGRGQGSNPLAPSIALPPCLRSFQSLAVRSSIHEEIQL